MIGTNNNKGNGGKIMFLNVKDGKILHRDGLVCDEFDYVEGSVTKIFQKEREFNGEKCLYWYIALADEKYTYMLSFPYSSGVFKSIVLALAADETIGLTNKVKIETYMKDGHTKATVSNSGKKLDWITKDLPPIKEVLVGGKVIKDDSDRMNFITNLVGEITARL